MPTQPGRVMVTVIRAPSERRRLRNPGVKSSVPKVGQLRVAAWAQRLVFVTCVARRAKGHPLPVQLVVTVAPVAPLTMRARTFVYVRVASNVHCIVELIKPSARGGGLTAVTGCAGAEESRKFASPLYRAVML